MKLKLGSTLIFSFGGLLAVGLSYWLHSGWYLFVLIPFIVWALLYSIEEINKLGWHYQLTSQYFKTELEDICKVCPYCGLVALSVIAYAATWAYLVVLQLLIYLWHSVWLMFGYRPDWRVLAYDYFHGNVRYMYKRRPIKNAPDYRQMIITGVRPVFMFVVVVPTVMLLLAFHVIQSPIHDFYYGQPLYFTIPATYLAVLAVAGLMELWLVTGWPVTKWFYAKSCPDAKFVEKVRVPADPQLPPAISSPN